MSLKIFHIIFIAVSSLVTLGFSLWAFSFYQPGGNKGYLLAGVVSAGACIGLVMYGVNFYKKICRLP